MASCPDANKYFPIKKSVALPAGTLKGKIALVTGGGTGLGKAIATTFATLGASVAIAARRVNVLEETAKEIRQLTGGICEPFHLDVKDPAKVTKTFDEVTAKFGKHPDILINNAAGNFIMATERLSPNAYGTIVDIVLKGTLHVTTELGRRCIKSKTGASVVSITTPYARSGAPFVVPSAVSKAGVETMTKSLANEWAKYGLRFNAVAPGPVPTKGAFGRLGLGSVEDTANIFKEAVPAGRAGTPEEVANLVAFISSDFMSWMSGAIIDLDGAQQYMHHGSSMGEYLHDLDEEGWKETENTIRGRTGKKSKL
ncbi:unnamed protein product [Caenorhabditis angaria]|uniref:Uncharacterized protein n=1 Tax=Caenorhabditis angaria TaxID=860376 RepID=A0A9P1I9L4_9PELO|nr:unnamed protein product [Caenorhabditis angaria]